MFMTFMMMSYLLIILSTILISVSSSNWMVVWMMMEINLMMFIPFLCSKKYLMDVSPSVKYFLAQVTGSIVLILFVVVNSMKNSMESMNSFGSSLMVISMAIKSGTPPFHFWFPQLIEMSNWIQMTALLTMQKAIPLAFLFFAMNSMFIAILMVSAIVGALGGLSQNSTKKIVAYSSMVHMAWLMASMTYSIKLTTTYFLIYSLLISILCYAISFSPMKANLNASLTSQSMVMNMIIVVMIMAIGGLPPFAGFFIKMMVVMSVKDINLAILVLIAASLVSMVFYMRLIYASFMSGFLTKKIKEKEYSLSLPVTYVVLMNLISPIFLTISY